MQIRIKQIFTRLFYTGEYCYKCNHCNHRVYPNQKFCGICGEEQDWEKCCACGSFLDFSDINYCRNCGSRRKEKVI